MECLCTTNTGFISGGLSGRDGYSVGGIGDNDAFLASQKQPIRNDESNWYSLGSFNFRIVKLNGCFSL